MSPYTLNVDGCIAIRTFSIRTAGAGASLMGERRGRANRQTGAQQYETRSVRRTDADPNGTGLDLIKKEKRLHQAVNSIRTCLSFVMMSDGFIKVVVTLGCSELLAGVHDVASDLFMPLCSGRGPDQCQDEDLHMKTGPYATTTWLNFPLLLRAAVQEQRFPIGSPLRARHRVVEGVRPMFTPLEDSS